MRATLDHLKFAVIKFDRNTDDNLESKVPSARSLVNMLWVSIAVEGMSWLFVNVHAQRG